MSSIMRARSALTGRWEGWEVIGGSSGSLILSSSAESIANLTSSGGREPRVQSRWGGRGMLLRRNRDLLPQKTEPAPFAAKAKDLGALRTASFGHFGGLGWTPDAANCDLPRVPSNAAGRAQV